MNVIIFGPPGVGKGTQSKRIQEAYGLCHVSTGDILRREIAKKSKTGLEAEQHVTRGEMVPDELIIRLVKRRLANDVQCQRNGWLLDGLPRTARQANAMVLAGLTPHHILVLDADDATVSERVLRRARDASHSGRKVRADDNAQTVRTRLREYHSNRNAVLNEFDKCAASPDSNPRSTHLPARPRAGGCTKSRERFLSQPRFLRLSTVNGEPSVGNVTDSIRAALSQ